MAGGQPTVLIADDEQEILEMLVAFVGDSAQVRTALDGNEALEKLDDSVDVVTLDRRMPWLSGDQVAQQVHESDMICKIIFVSAVSPEDMSYPDCDEYLEKPIRPDEFRQAIFGLL